jgi:hypothetical protein
LIDFLANLLFNMFADSERSVPGRGMIEATGFRQQLV